MEIALTVRDLDATDPAELTWTGGEDHLAAIRDGLALHYGGERPQLVVELPNRHLVGHGVLDLRPDPDAGLIMMLAVHPVWQSLGIGTALITALEDRIRENGRRRAQLTVEHDNPRAAALYRRIGYREIGSVLDHWPEGHGRTYVTVCSLLEKAL